MWSKKWQSIQNQEAKVFRSIMTKESNCINQALILISLLILVSTVKNVQKEKVRGYSVFIILVATCQTLLKRVMTLQKDDLYAAPAVEWTMMSAARTFRMPAKSNPQLCTSRRIDGSNNIGSESDPNTVGSRFLPLWPSQTHRLS